MENFCLFCEGFFKVNDTLVNCPQLLLALKVSLIAIHIKYYNINHMSRFSLLVICVDCWNIYRNCSSTC